MSWPTPAAAPAPKPAAPAKPLGPPALVDPRKAVGADEVMIATYNVENLFDTSPEPGSDYAQFTPEGDYAWTEAQLDKKLENLGRVIRTLNGGQGPGLLALTEVQSKCVLEKLRDGHLAELGYASIVHLDGEDERGIDNAILSKFPLIGAPKLHRIHDPSDPIWGEHTTREILEATFDVMGVPLTALVVHLPRDLGGVRKQQRMLAAAKLRALMDALEAAHPGREVVVLGDFNSNPGRPELAALAAADPAEVKAKQRPAYNTLACLADQLAQAAGGARVSKLGEIDAALAAHGDRLGTIRTHSGWAALDHILVSRGLLDDEGLAWVPGSTAILREPWMLDAAGSPRATFAPGVPPKKRTAASIGVSDHLPVSAVLRRL